MKAVEDKDAPDVIVGNFHIFETDVHALIDPGSTHSYICIAISSLVVYQRVKPSIIFW